jgi:hypothetical protein
LGIAAEVDRHTGLVTNNPRIVTRPDRGNVARADLALLSAAHLNAHAARQAVQQVRRLVSFRAGCYWLVARVRRLFAACWTANCPALASNRCS